jgi:hypothetical protein
MARRDRPLRRGIYSDAACMCLPFKIMFPDPAIFPTFEPFFAVCKSTVIWSPAFIMSLYQPALCFIMLGGGVSTVHFCMFPLLSLASTLTIQWGLMN